MSKAKGCEGCLKQPEGCCRCRAELADLTGRLLALQAAVTEKIRRSHVGHPANKAAPGQE